MYQTTNIGTGIVKTNATHVIICRAHQVFGITAGQYHTGLFIIKIRLEMFKDSTGDLVDLKTLFKEQTVSLVASGYSTITVASKVTLNLSFFQFDFLS